MKKILYRGVPVAQVLTEQLGAVFPPSLDRQENGQLIAECDLVTGYNPTTGAGEIPVAEMLNPATGAYRSVREPTSIEYGTIATLGNHTIHTTTAGKSYRLMGLVIVLDNAVTTAAGSVLSLKDGATVIMVVAAVGLTEPGRTIVIPFGPQGILLGQGNSLVLNTSVAFTAGVGYCGVWGCEE